MRRTGREGTDIRSLSFYAFHFSFFRTAVADGWRLVNTFWQNRRGYSLEYRAWLVLTSKAPIPLIFQHA